MGLKELTQNFAIQGAHRGWTEALNAGAKEVGAIAVESFAVATENPEVRRVLAKFGKRIIDSVVEYTRRCGQHPEARTVVERLMMAKVQAAAGELVDDAGIQEIVRRTLDDEYGNLLPELLPEGCGG